MPNRKELIGEIIENLYTIKNKMYARCMTDAKSRTTYSQGFVLSIIDQQKNIGIKEISEILSVSSSAATQLVNELVKNGYVKRKEDAKDRRALNLALLPRGGKQIMIIRKEHIKMAEELFKSLSEKDLKTLTNIHKKILS